MPATDRSRPPQVVGAELEEELAGASSPSDLELQRLEAWQTLLAAEMPSPRCEPIAAKVARGELPRATLLQHDALTPSEAQRAGGADLAALTAVLESGARLVQREEFPERLAGAPGSPPALFAWGDWACALRPCVAIVGTRGASTYGKAVATKFAEALGAAGATVVSGGALGIDAAAHRGALTANGRTIAVLAGGIDRVYPSIHGSLFRDIRASGCLVSQFAAGARPEAYMFVKRNNLIAALSDAMILVEAPIRSGALVTAQAANDLGRQVFVVPANIDNLKFSGSHALIRDGATLVDHPDQVLEALGLEKGRVAERKEPESEIAKRILAVLSVEPKSPEKIVESTGLDAAEVLSELTMLELDGSVFRDAGGYALKP